MKRSTLLGVSLVATLSAAHSATAETILLSPARDNTLFGTDGTTSNGAGDSVFSGRTGLNAGQVRQRALLKFDVSGAIAPGSTVNSAQLTLTLLASGVNGNQTHTLHRVLRDWGEGASAGQGGSGAPALPGDATWLHTFFPDEFWKNQGGDFDASAVASAVVGTVPLSSSTWGPTPEMTAVVQDWLDNPAANFGLLIFGNEDLFNTAKRFASREYPMVNIRPVLVVEFTLPCLADVSDDGVVDGLDVMSVLEAWGVCGANCPADVNGDATVNAFDLALVLGGWGPCE